jgi:hypothetical protein
MGKNNLEVSSLNLPDLNSSYYLPLIPAENLFEELTGTGIKVGTISYKPLEPHNSSNNNN